MQDLSNVAEIMNLYNFNDVNSYLKDGWILIYIHTFCDDPVNAPNDQEQVFTIAKLKD